MKSFTKDLHLKPLSPQTIWTTDRWAQDAYSRKNGATRNGEYDVIVSSKGSWINKQKIFILESNVTLSPDHKFPSLIHRFLQAVAC